MSANYDEDEKFVEEPEDDPFGADEDDDAEEDDEDEETDGSVMKNHLPKPSMM